MNDWKKEYVALGYVSSAHALKGEVKIIFDVHNLDEYLSRRTFYLAAPDELPRKIRINRMNPATKGVIVKIEGINDRNASEALVGSTLYFPIRLLPKLEEGRFYYFEVEGFEVMDKNLGSIGAVKSFEEGAAQDLLIISYQGKDVYVPVTDEFVLTADKEKKTLFTHLPEGLLELYMGEESPDQI